MNSTFAGSIRVSLQMVVLVGLWLPLASVAAVYSGTGFFVSADGYIATNYHVIEGAEEISVRDSTGNVLKASVVLQDRANDLAVIKVSGRGFPVLPTRNSAEVKKGTTVFTLGFPNTNIQGREIKVTEGIVSSLSGIMGEPTSFQITVPVQPGNSGGPLIDQTGAVVGVTTSKLSAAAMLKKGRELPENVNYAVKSNYLLELIGTDSNVNKHVVRSTSQKVQPLTALVEKAERAVVFIVVSKNSAQDESRPSEKKSEVPRYIRDAQANESFQRGSAAFNRNDYQEALVNFGKAAEFGHAQAQYNLGVMYANGQGVTKDEAEAVRWYRKAAEQGIAMAQGNLGVMYANGQGVTKDEAEAVRWYRKAAEQGDVNAQYNLGHMYRYGRGVTEDNAEAARWYRKADQGLR